MLKIISKIVDIDNKGWFICKIKSSDIKTIKEFENDENSKLFVNDKEVNEIITFGKIDDPTGDDFISVMKKTVPYVLQKQNGEFKKSYKCYAGHVGNKHNLIVHEDAGSSVNCLLNVLSKPEEVLIFK